MSFATLVRNRKTERFIALMAALAVLLSMMVIYAAPAQAHNGTVTWDCDGWIIDLNNYPNNNPSGVSPTSIQVTVDGVVVDAETDWVNYDNSGTWDPATSHTLRVVVDAWDDDDQPVYNLGSNSSFSPAWTTGEYSFTINVTQESCVDEVVTTFSISGSCVFEDDTAIFAISGQLGEGLTLEVAGQTITTAGPFSVAVGAPGDYAYDVTVTNGYVLSGGSPDVSSSVNIADCTPPPSGWVCENGEVFFMQDASGYQGTLYDTEEEAATDPDCTPPPPPSGWACVDGSAVFIQDATNFDGTLYDSQQEAMDDPECQQVLASTTFTISGNCAASNDVAGFTISGNLGEGVTLEVAGQTLTAVGAFSIDVGAAGTYPYTVTLDDGFTLAVGSPPAEATIVIEDCTPTITVTAVGLCDNDTPYLAYTATVSGDVAPGADTVTIHWFDANGVERNPADTAHQYTGLPMSGRVLWPGARVDSSGDPTDWPGWVLDGDEWIQTDDGFMWARQTGVTVTLEVNPTSDPITVVYPPADPDCSANPPDEVEDVEIVDEVDDVDELPFTGLDADIMAAVAAVLLGTGFVVVATSRRREDSH